MEAIKSVLGRDNDNLQPLSFVPNSRRQIFRPLTTQVEQDGEHEENTGSDAILSWSGELSLFQRFTVVECHETLHKTFSSSIRKEIQKQMISELKKMAGSSILSRNTQASAALSVSQCLTIGFDSVYNTDDIIFWLRYALTLGCPFTFQWCPRICDALCPDAPWLSQVRCLNVIDPGIRELNQSYLASCIRRERLTGWRVVPSNTAQDQQWGSISHATIFKSCLSVEVANFLREALVGDNILLEFDLEFNPPKSSEVVSPQGFTLVHCACLGGHLSTLRLLLGMGYSATQPTIHGITPLHLCIFFAECDIEVAVHLLLECGPNSRETTSVIYWLDCDLTLSGSLLSWAISTRNLKLVKILLPKYVKDRPADIRRALGNYYWEILDEILRTSPSEENLWDIYLFNFEQLPYGHWIAHGSDRFSLIDRTLEVVQRHNLIPIGESRNATGCLTAMMGRANTKEHFHHIKRLLEIMTASQIKSVNGFQGSPLIIAIMRAKKNTMWIQVFKALLVKYTVEELHRIRL
ncbi:hypothetical protein AOQ84DRAFT_378317 [Glonium stellatum]|uniref:Ankyrin repeat protein n=1 Tax=Glonium stellatum TaxID=574774 RepID=A0A8E2JRH7_9PEZI|nr:hypothetical protein AOQ84DRAFT_378317 [Glonium stellatum]